MKKELLIALIAKLVEEKVKSLEPHVETKTIVKNNYIESDFDFSKHREEVEKYIDSLFSSYQLPEEVIERITPKDGKDGKDGVDGHSFVFEEHKEEIEKSIRSFVEEISPDLKGRDGKDGNDGKSFEYEEHREEIESFLSERTQAIWQDIENTLPSLKGKDGKDGHSFYFEDHKEEITNLIAESVEAISEDLKLKFSDLNEEEKNSLKLKFSDLSPEEVSSLKLKYSDLTEFEIAELRGPRGQRGKKGDDGKDGLSAFELWKLQGNEGSVDDFIKSLKGETGPRGPRGEIGPQGVSIVGPKGANGENGKDAPVITDIEVVQRFDDSFKLNFQFSDGSEIDTSEVNLPVAKVKREIYIAGGGGGSGGTGTDGKSAYEIAVDNGFVGTEADWLLSLEGEDGTDGLSAYEIALANGFVGTEAEWLASLQGADGNDASVEFFKDGVSLGTASELEFVGTNITATKTGDRVTVSVSGGGGGGLEVIENVPCDPSVYVGAAVRMDYSAPAPTTMSQWPTLSAVFTLDATTYTSLAVNALADTYDNSNVIGLVESKPTPTTCNIRVSGVTAPNYFGLDIIEEYYLSADVPGGLVVAALAPTTSGSVLLKIGQPFGPSTMLYQRGERMVRA